MKKSIAIAILAGISILLIFYFSSSISSFLIKDGSTRPGHCNENGCIYLEAFSKLPEYPQDLKVDAVTLENETYYKQPEFYPTFEENKFYYIDPPQNYLGFYGYGSFPSEGTYHRKSNEEITSTFLMYTSWYVIKYQGIKLDVVMDESIKKYFDVTIEPDVILLEPTYPVFEYNWTQKVTVKVKIKDPPQGQYSIGMIVSPAPGEYSQIWSEKHGLKYTSGGFFTLNQPIYKLDVRIE